MGGENERIREDATGGEVEEFEPDYRFTLANERTFLAWLRTALALLAAAVAVVQLVPEFALPGARRISRGLLAAMGLGSALSGPRRVAPAVYAHPPGLSVARP